jgi:hypothetical protein
MFPISIFESVCVKKFVNLKKIQKGNLWSNSKLNSFTKSLSNQLNSNKTNMPSNNSIKTSSTNTFGPNRNLNQIGRTINKTTKPRKLVSQMSDSDHVFYNTREEIPGLLNIFHFFHVVLVRSASIHVLLCFNVCYCFYVELFFYLFLPQIPLV